MVLHVFNQLGKEFINMGDSPLFFFVFFTSRGSNTDVT